MVRWSESYFPGLYFLGGKVFGLDMRIHLIQGAPKGKGETKDSEGNDSILLHKRDDHDLRLCVYTHGRPPGASPAGGID
jgi:hypothetical protein